MLRRIARAVQEHRSSILFTRIGGEPLGSLAVLDGEAFGDISLIPDGFDPSQPLPDIHDDVLIERITATPQLVLCGGGHVAVQTAKIAKMVGFSVTVIDDRSDFANRERFPDADRILVGPYTEMLRSVSAVNTYFVIVTRGHKDDRTCLESILEQDFTYCGLIGSRTKIRLLFEDLERNGFDPNRLRKVHAPIGLSIGANTPEEIAVCIVGELISVKNREVCGVEWDTALLQAVLHPNGRYAMCTVISKRGSAPRSTGARMIVTGDGKIISSVGGGYGEFEAASFARDMLQNGPAARRYTCNMNNTDAAEAGMVCGGSIDLLIQIVEA